jgi:hypothetical protein
MVRAIHPDTDHDGQAAARADLALDQNTSALLAGQQQIVRPFEPQLLRQRHGFRHDRVAQRQDRDKGEFRRALERRRIAQQQARIEIARRRVPGTAEPAAAGGFCLRCDPERRAFAAAGTRASLLVGRTDGRQRHEPDARLGHAGIKLHQNSE